MCFYWLIPVIAKDTNIVIYPDDLLLITELELFIATIHDEY